MEGASVHCLADIESDGLGGERNEGCIDDGTT
jgi:hypothetical protein